MDLRFGEQSPEVQRLIDALDESMRVYLCNSWNLEGRPALSAEYIRRIEAMHSVNRRNPITRTDSRYRDIPSFGVSEW